MSTRAATLRCARTVARGFAIGIAAGIAAVLGAQVLVDGGLLRQWPGLLLCTLVAGSAFPVLDDLSAHASDARRGVALGAPFGALLVTTWLLALSLGPH